MPESGIELGVDLGTSNTVAVVRLPDGRSRSLLFDGSPLLPSAVYAEPTGATVVGRDAVHSARLEPARFEPNPKRRIDDTAVLLGDREIPVIQLLAAVLARVADEYRRTVGGGTPQVTITCPAAWGATRRLVLADAATAAGLGQVRLVPEPVAAATYFTQVLGKAVPVGSVVVVHDFGAGTFDASVVARTAAGFEVLAVDGRDDLGGLDVDEAIIGHIRKICEERDPAAWMRLGAPSTVDDRRARRLLWDDVRVAKERLSRQSAADLTVPLLNIDIHLTREELEVLAQPIVEQTIRVTQGVMRWAQLPEGRVAGVFLVGGSSRMPLVATLLHRALGEPPVAIDSPELVVAEGSLLAASAAQQPAAAGPAPGPQTGVMPRALLSDGTLEPLTPTSIPPAAADAPGPYAGSPVGVSGAPPGPGQPVSGQPWPGQPASGPPAYGLPPASAPPAYGQPPASAPPAYGPSPASAPQGYGQPPASGPPAYGQPASGPPWGGPSGGYPQVSAPPAAPVSASPVSASPSSAPPVSSPPTSEGRVYVSGRAVVPDAPPSDQIRSVPSAPPAGPQPGQPTPTTRPVPRADEPAYREPAYRESAYREPAYAEPGPRPSTPPAAGSASALRLLRVIFVTILLVSVPLISAYVAYKLTVNEPLLP